MEGRGCGGLEFLDSHLHPFPLSKRFLECPPPRKKKKILQYLLFDLVNNRKSDFCLRITTEFEYKIRREALRAL